MDRRQFLTNTAAVSLLSTVQPALGQVGKHSSAWPSQQQWDTLRTTVDGRLLEPKPLLAGCSTEATSCEALIKQLENPFFIGDQPSGTQVSGWYKAWSPATSAYALRAESAADVVAAVNFARKHNVRLAVKGGGHSYLGTSNAPDSLLIWTRAMNAITLHDNFVAAGCDGVQVPCHAVSVGAGCMWIDVYDAVTTKAGRYVQGGGCTTVGVAGLIQSGGFGSFSKQFGTAAGGLLEAEVVTADGQLRIANPKRNPDLFWALKGGGGGSLGVVTRLTLRTHELPELFGAAFGTIKAQSDDAFRRLIARFIALYADSLFNPHWGESVHFGRDNTLRISMVCQGIDNGAAVAAWTPFLDWVNASPDYEITDKFRAGVAPARGWWDAAFHRKYATNAMIADERMGASPAHAWWRGDKDQVGAYIFGYDSIWLPASLLAPPQQQRLTDTLYLASREFPVAIHFNKGLAGAPSDAIARSRDTATNPEMLDAFGLVIVSSDGASRYPGLPVAPLDDTAAARNAAAIDRAMVPLKAVAPAAGSYVSESNYFNPDPAKAYWGANAVRLRQAKAKYDPHELFFVHNGIGSEKWAADRFVRHT